MKIPARPIVVVVCVLLAAVAAWAIFGRARAVVTPTGGQAGRIIGGVSADSLNVIVLTLDTTRWDRLGAYGDVTASTPNLDRLASEGVLFEEAIAPSRSRCRRTRRCSPVCCRRATACATTADTCSIPSTRRWPNC